MHQEKAYTFTIFQTTVAGGNAFSAATDILIAGILIHSLHKNHSGLNLEYEAL